MAAYDNTQLNRLYESLVHHVGEEQAQAFAEAHLLPKAPSPKRKAEWACQICRDLEAEYDESQIQCIRMDCHCSPSAQAIRQMRKQYLQADSLAAYAEAASSEAFSLWTEGDSLYMCYPVCYCSAVKNSDVLPGKTWCACTLGYTKYLYEKIFDCPVSVELCESVKSGGTRCVIKIDRIG